MPCAGTGNANAVGGSKLAQAEATFRIDAAAATLSPVSQHLQALCVVGLLRLLRTIWVEPAARYRCA